ncbi:MAG TPA: hypothetical protein VH599_14700 [Ktedonobacterales bacterium]
MLLHLQNGGLRGRALLVAHPPSARCAHEYSCICWRCQLYQPPQGSTTHQGAPLVPPPSRRQEGLRSACSAAVPGGSSSGYRNARAGRRTFAQAQRWPPGTAALQVAAGDGGATGTDAAPGARYSSSGRSSSSPL